MKMKHIWRITILKCFCFLANLVTIVNGVQTAFTDSIGTVTITPEMRLHDRLFPEPYGAKSFPEYGKVVNVNFTIKPLAVVDIEIQNEAIVINANIIQDWVNPSITWDSTEYENISKINVRPEKIWTPDIYAYANIEDDKKYNGLFSTFNTQVIVRSDGLNSWLATITMRLSCTMNTKNYPFDKQVCPLQFGSFTYDSSRISLTPHIKIGSYSESPEWYYISMNSTTLMNKRLGSSIPFNDVLYTIVMKRKPLYPLTISVIPNLILAFLTILVYFIPVDSGERVMYIFTIFLAVTWFMMSNIETMPNNATIPLITYFLGISVISLSLLSFCLCYTITCYYADSQIVSMPKWIRLYILEQFGRCLGIEVDRKRSAWREKLHDVRKLDKYLVNTQELFNGNEKPIDDNDDDSSGVQGMDGYISREPSMNSFNPNELSPSSQNSDNGMNDKLGSLWTGQQDHHQHQVLMDDDFFNEEIIRCLHIQVETLLKKYEDEEDSNWRQMEWQLVAKTLDKMFFYFFTSSLCLTVFACVMQVVTE